MKSITPLLLLVVAVCFPACSKTSPTNSEPPGHVLSDLKEPTETQLNECLNQTADEVVQRLRLGEAKRIWTDEPPGILRGVSYYFADGRRMTLYIAESEPLFRTASDRSEWDYGAFLRSRVGGIQYHSGDIQLDIGPAVPFQWRR
jgi:hypothetical protein